jgi:hypothetical protein
MAQQEEQEMAEQEMTRQQEQQEELIIRWRRSELNEMDAWHQLDWCVRFARVTDLSTVPADEQKRWTEELAAMLLRAATPIVPVPAHNARYPNSESPEDHVIGMYPLTVSESQGIRNEIASHLTDLADGQGTYIGPFAVEFGIKFVHVHDTYGRHRVPRHHIYRTEISVGKSAGGALLRHLARLLETYCDHVRRCCRPSCRQLFLQFRRQQRYCDRTCQSIDVMQKKRAIVKVNRKKRLKGVRKKRRNGRSRHGQKGR